MDPVSARYRELARRIVRYYAQFKPAVGDIEVETIVDEDGGHYELVHTGWEGWERVHATILHLDVRPGEDGNGPRIWIQHDGTEDGVANELVREGVPADRIVLAFQHPFRRKITGFAPV